MPQVSVKCLGMSLDGFSAGTDQSLENPLGVRGPEIMEWFFPTQVFKSMLGLGDGEKGIDNSLAEDSFKNVGAYIMGRNMFGPIRGPWPDENWKGWWGDEPPYHTPVFVLTHHPRASIQMKGGTEFHFVTDGTHAALERARAAAARATCASAAACPPCGNTCGNVSSTNCICRFGRSCWAPAKT